MKRKKVFHASPESDIYRIQPKTGHQAVRMNKPGVYVAPTFKDAVAWAVSYVAHKRKNTHYKNITIYTLSVPVNALKNAWTNDWWEKEYFLPEETDIRTISKETFTYEELSKKHARFHSKAWDAKKSKYDYEKVAEELKHNNLAAKIYLLLKKRYNELALLCFKPVERRKIRFTPYNRETLKYALSDKTPGSVKWRLCQQYPARSIKSKEIDEYGKIRDALPKLQALFAETTHYGEIKPISTLPPKIEKALKKKHADLLR